jgi:hypothetical protein
LLGNGLRMRTAAVLDRYHPAVGGRDLVGAGAETSLQRTAERDEEAATAAGGWRLPSHRAVRAELARVPAVGSVETSEPGQHPDPAQTEFERDLLDLRIVGGKVARYQSGIVRSGGQQVAGAEIARLQPFTPRHPLGCEQRVLTGQQHHLGNGRLPIRRPHHGDRPAPADVARQFGGEGVGGRELALGPDAEVLAHRGAGHLDRTGPGLLHCGGQHRVDGLRIGSDSHISHCGIRTPTRVASLTAVGVVGQDGRVSAAENPGRAGSDAAAADDGFSAPTYHHPQPDPEVEQPADQPLEVQAGRPARVAPTGTGSVTVTRAVLARSRYFSKLVAHKVIVASEADGARESGLTAMIWNQVMSYAADAMVTVALAGTVFFSATSDAKRGNVLLYLLITMAPFAVVAPVIGPALDRVQHGRRWVMAGTAIGRAALAVVMALNFTNLLLLFPAALGSLVLSKAYAVIRSSAAPRLVPTNLTLVEANARLSLFGLAAAILGGGIVGAAIKVTGSYPFGLWITAAAFAVTAYYSFRLPKIVDALPPVPNSGASSVLDKQARPRLGIGARLLAWTKRGFAPPVILALQGECALRWLSGFLTLFLAFYIEARSHGFDAVLSLGAIGAATGLGNFGGTALGTRLKLARPDLIILFCTGAAAIGCVAATLLFSMALAVVAIFICMLCNSLSKLSLDAIIQRDVAESLRSSAFGRSETFLQLAWVLGAAIALLLPSNNGTLGFLVAAIVLVGVALSMAVHEKALRSQDAKPAVS